MYSFGVRVKLTISLIPFFEEKKNTNFDRANKCLVTFTVYLVFYTVVISFEKDNSL